jgi:hypothetical protein
MLIPSCFEQGRTVGADERGDTRKRYLRDSSLAIVLIPSAFDLIGLSAPAREAESVSGTSLAATSNYTDTIRLRPELDMTYRRDRRCSQGLSQQL